ncbi:hypothetical protein [Saccharothrix sp. Mg75]|uniref:hypothetical protein n=1 Tax=Saccharothrix sp. Mg75 TaxID=3445357 RepID=UPI003EE9A686
MKSPDAVHLASTPRLREGLTAFVAYDERLLTAADEIGLPVAAPGTAGATG